MTSISLLIKDAQKNAQTVTDGLALQAARPAPTSDPRTNEKLTELHGKIAALSRAVGDIQLVVSGQVGWHAATVAVVVGQQWCAVAVCPGLLHGRASIAMPTNSSTRTEPLGSLTAVTQPFATAAAVAVEDNARCHAEAVLLSSAA